MPVGERLARLHEQEGTIEQVAELCADSIAARRLVHVFGAGHSRMAAEEAYPRIGAIVGFHPVVELAVTHFHPVVGPNGLRQTIFLERAPGYGRVIFEELDADPADVVMLFSSSGGESIILDFVDAAHERGCKVVGVTSFEYSAHVAAERGGARRLADIADVALDNLVPVGDALITLDGLAEPVGPCSSVLSLALMDAITVATAAALLRRGVEPLAFVSPHLAGDDRSAERLEQCLVEYRKRVYGTRS